MGARATWICARATSFDFIQKRINNAIWCKGHNLRCKHDLKFLKILRPLHLFSWPLHVALALLLLALALALAPRKMSLFGHLSRINFYNYGNTCY